MSAARKLPPISSVPTEVAGLAGQILDPHVIGLADNLAPDEVLRFASEQKLSHLCQRQGFQFDRELQSSQTLVQDPTVYFQHPLATILTPLDVNAAAESKHKKFEFKFNNSNLKRDALSGITQVLVGEGLAQTAIDDALSVADELFTNAIYNAPFADLISLKNPGLSRQEIEIRLEDGKECRVFIGMDKDHTVVCCEDPYGNLNLDRYMQKVRNTYLKGPAATMNFGPGGAGIGSYIIFNAGSSMYLGVNPGQSTLLCCVIPRGISYRKRTQLPKHLHWVQL